ncbi:hypothetical protein GCM10010468_82130 [Actinocorallia longicatena]|uniref:Uncharacterized protein n=1 Tax=Actinocorallia longicatena TaxID=111803 RepID=A0ABP6QS19_9ACTN
MFVATLAVDRMRVRKDQHLGTLEILMKDAAPEQRSVMLPDVPAILHAMNQDDTLPELRLNRGIPPPP